MEYMPRQTLKPNNLPLWQIPLFVNLNLMHEQLSIHYRVCKNEILMLFKHVKTYMNDVCVCVCVCVPSLVREMRSYIPL